MKWETWTEVKKELTKKKKTPDQYEKAFSKLWKYIKKWQKKNQ